MNKNESSIFDGFCYFKNTHFYYYFFKDTTSQKLS